MAFSRRRRAIFLDRDGVIVQEVDHLWNIGDVRFIPGIFSALRQLQRTYSLIIITNQAGIARGLYDEQDFQKLTQWMNARFRRAGLGRIPTLYCPHHPNGIRSRFRKCCACRKPNVELFRLAARKYHISLKHSWCIGDKTSDILAGKRAGCRTVLVRTGYGGRDRQYGVKPDIIASDLPSVVRLIDPSN